MTNSLTNNDLLKENQLLRMQLGQKFQEIQKMESELHSAERKMRINEADNPEQVKRISDLILENQRLKNKLLVAHQRVDVLQQEKEELHNALRELYEEFGKPEEKKSIWKRAFNLLLLKK